MRHEDRWIDLSYGWAGPVRVNVETEGGRDPLLIADEVAYHPETRTLWLLRAGDRPYERVIAGVVDVRVRPEQED